MLIIAEIAFLSEEHTNWKSNTKKSALKPYIQITVYRLSRVYFRHIIIYIYSYNNHQWKRSLAFERESKVEYGKISWDKGE